MPDASGNYIRDASGNYIRDASGNSTKDASGNSTKDASGNSTKDASGNSTKDASGNSTKNASGNSTKNESNNQSQKIDTSNIFKESNLDLINWFLAIYLVIYFGFGIFINTNKNAFNQTVDIALFIGIITFLIYYYFKLSEYDRSHISMTLLKEFKHELKDPEKTALYMIIILVICYLFMFIFKIPYDIEKMPLLLHFIIAKSLIYLIMLLFVMFFTYILGIPIVDNIYDTVGKWWNDLSKSNDSSVSNSKTEEKKRVIDKDEVFNISNNLYTYDDAQNVCSAFGARLATYDEIEDAYNKGADWCNYGWSDNQMAFFPTQKETWQKLQKKPKNKNNCGRPGVNGGYMANPYIKFGVNCFGKKPKATESDLDLMSARKNQITPKTASEIETERKVQFWKENADKLLNINPHNEKKWSEY
jgi:hypothetical protein